MHLQFNKGGLRFFFFTAAIRGRQPLLSRIVPRAPGRQRPGEASPEPPRSGRRDPRAGWGVELAPAGEAVARLWREVHARDPFLTASDFILMPDHAHLLLLVDYRRAPVGFDLLGWWLRFRRETAAAAAAALPGIEPSAFWEEKYWIMILNAGTSLPAVRRYIKLNPARKMWKASHPDLFARHADLRHPVLDPALPWSAMGDLTLLGSPFLFPVVLTRKKTLEQHEAEIADILERARNGAIPVCGFLSPGEKRVLELLRKEPGTRWIRTVAHGLPPRFDPSAEESRYLAERRQLVLSSFPSEVPEFPVNWTNCHIMNDRNAALCARAAAGADHQTRKES